MTKLDQQALILVVEDDEAIRRLTMMTLAEEGFVSVGVANGRQALSAAEKRQPDLVVLDVNLPGAPGTVVAMELRRLCGEQLPILAVSANEKLSDAARAMGAFAQLKKPFDLDSLALAVRSGLRLPRTLREFVQPPDGRNAPEERLYDA